MNVAACLTLIVAVGVHCVHAQMGGRRPGRFLFGEAGGVSVWRRTVDSGTVRQVGVSVDTENVVAVGTFGRQLRSLGLRRSAALLDFTNDDPITVIRTGPRCYLIPAPVGLTFAAASAEVASRNGTTVTDVPREAQRNATGKMLDDNAREALVTARPAVGALCSSADIFDTESADLATFPDPGAEAEGQVVTSALTLRAKVNILADRPSNGPEPMGRRPGGRGLGGRPFGGRRPGGRRPGVQGPGGRRPGGRRPGGRRPGGRRPGGRRPGGRRPGGRGPGGRPGGQGPGGRPGGQGPGGRPGGRGPGRRLGGRPGGRPGRRGPGGRPGGRGPGGRPGGRGPGGRPGGRGPGGRPGGRGPGERPGGAGVGGN